LDDLIGCVPSPSSSALRAREAVAADSDMSWECFLEANLGDSTGGSVRRVRLGGLMSIDPPSRVRGREDLVVDSDSSRERFFCEDRGVEEV